MKSQDDQKNISHQEVNKRMENMVKRAKDQDHAFKIERLRAQYKDEIQKNEDDRIKARIHHSMGERSGLHQQSVKEVDQIYADKNQKVTDKIYPEAKNIYTKTCDTASKSFATSKLKDVPKHDFNHNKNLPDKDTPEKETISLSDKFNLSKEKGKLKFDFEKYRDNLKQENKTQNISSKLSLTKEQDNLKFNFNKNKDMDMER